MLQSFPSAAIGGVQWRVLVRKYEERYSTRLDLAALDHSSPLSAAASLLWDVLRLVDSEDTDNPVVAIEDTVAMVPRPGFLGSWPSLYNVLCEVIRRHGTPYTAVDGEQSHVLLLSQLKQLLQSHWHADFTESMQYLSEEGSSVQIKKMKHLVQAVLRWRKQRFDSLAESCTRWGLVEDALAPQIDLVPSTKHNDLMLRYVHPRKVSVPHASPHLYFVPHTIACGVRGGGETTVIEADEPCLSRTSSRSTTTSTNLELEVATLRADNAVLRTRNESLQHQGDSAVTFAELFHTLAKPQLSRQPEVFDDPFEPPPEARSQYSFWNVSPSPVGSTAAPSDFGFSLGSATPADSAVSGAATPLPIPTLSMPGMPGAFLATTGFVPASCQVSAMMPSWFFSSDQFVQIPSGIVQQSRALFEQSTTIPSFFVQQ